MFILHLNIKSEWPIKTNHSKAETQCEPKRSPLKSFHLDVLQILLITEGQVDEKRKERKQTKGNKGQSHL